MEKIEYKGIPGPWKRYPEDTFCIVSDYNPAGLTYVAKIEGLKGYESPEATADLIAAAPLLLSALIKAVEQEDKNAHQFFLQLPPYTPGEYGFPDWYYDAKDAIAKATNTTQP